MLSSHILLMNDFWRINYIVCLSLSVYKAAVQPRIIFTRKILLSICKLTCPPLNKLWLYINTCAIDGMWAELYLEHRIKLISKSQN